MEPGTKSTSEIELPQEPKLETQGAEVDSSREAVLEIRRLADVLDSGTEDGSRPLDETAAIGVAALIRLASEHLEREFTRLYRARGVKF
jgi:hypothetical protein